MRRRDIRLAFLGMGVMLALVPVCLAYGRPIGAGALVLGTAMYSMLFYAARESARRVAFQTSESLRMALHDPVTDLPNRVLFHDRVQHAIDHADRLGRPIAVLLFDLDRFKEINDTLGHHNGDLLLHRVGERLNRNVRAADSVARLGGDEFAVLLTDVGGDQQARAKAEELHALVGERLEFEGIGIEVEPSIGIAMYPEHGETPEALLQSADVAMYAAKRAHSGLAVYSRKIDSYSRDRLGLVAEVRRAIENDEIVLHFQPKARLRDGRVGGVEALARWQHPERGLLSPVEFIPFAEHTGLMRPLTMHILDLALAQVRRWADAGLDLGVAVNISTRNLLDLTLPDETERLLEKHGVSASRLEFEVTETTIMADPPRAKAVLARLDAIGISLAIDDFGTGYTSLSWLRDLPLSTLKIDKSFVLNMAAGTDDSVIVRSTAQLGRNLGLQVVAEGVETQQVWDQLCDLGCDIAQGYFFSRPKPAGELTSLLEELAAGGVDGRQHGGDLRVVG